MEAIVKPDGFNTAFGFVPLPDNCAICKERNINLFFRAEETDFCNTSKPHLCGKIQQCICLGDHFELKIQCKDCDLCRNELVNNKKPLSHSFMLKSYNHNYKPGDFVHSCLKNFKIKENEDKQVAG